MPTNDENFKISGPRFTGPVDWEEPSHLRIVMASLVQGVYVQESDRQNRVAPSWWESFNFRLQKPLYDKKDNSIFGAIYQLNAVVPFKSPKFVVAFRGTDINLQDLKLDINIIANKLKNTSRVKQALDSVRHLITTNSQDWTNIWLAGHSMGAAIALIVGKDLARHDNLKLETFLFNPPIVSIPINLFINDEKIKKMTRAATSLGRFFANMLTASDVMRNSADPFHAIREWMPHLYVNKADIFCSEYISYFENRETMKKYGLGMVEKIANGVAFRRNEVEVEPMHLLASAELTICKKGSFPEAHLIRQWWNIPEKHFELKIYRY